MDTDRTSMMTSAAAGAFADESCKACETTIPAGDEFCPKCGYQRGTWQGDGAAASAPAAAPAASAAPASGPGLWTLASDSQEWPLSAGTHELGRGEVAIRIDDGYASRRHAQLAVTGESVTLTDLSSSNGTFVSERRLEPNAPEALGDGATFRIANTPLTLTRAASAAAEQEIAGGEGTQVMSTQNGAAETDSEGTKIDPGSQPEPGKEGQAPSHPSESKWELSREDGTTIEIPLGEMTLGRKAEATQVLEGDSFVSGVHCRLVATIERLELTDLNSTNGTFVNDARIDAEQPWQLATGDVLRIGQTTFTVANNKPTEGQELEEQDS